MFRPVAMLIALMAATGLRAQSVEVDAKDRDCAGKLTVDKSSLRLSETLAVTLSVTTPRDAKVTWPTAAAFGENWFVTEPRESLPAVALEGDRRTWSGVLRPRRPGSLSIGPVVVSITVLGVKDVADGAMRRLEWRATVDVTSALLSRETTPAGQLKTSPPTDPDKTTSDAAGNQGIAPGAALVRELPPGQYEGPVAIPAPVNWLAWTLLGTTAVVLIAAAVWFVKQAAHSPAPVLSPHDLAFKALSDLGRDEAARREPKLFVTRATSIVRTWIEATTAVRAPELTTDEFLAMLERRPVFPTDARHRLRLFLEAADLVKFAGVVPLEDALDQTVDTAKLLVRRWSALSLANEPARHDESPGSGLKGLRT